MRAAPARASRLERAARRARRARVASLLIGSMALTVIGAAARPVPPVAGDQVLIEDQTKHLSLRPPEGWLYDGASSADKLIFNGPKGGGTTAWLHVEALLDGRPLDAAQPEILARLLGDDAASNKKNATGGLGPDTVIEPLETKGLASIDRAVVIAHKVKRKKVRSVVATARNGPYLIVLTFQIGASLYQRYEPAIRECLASLTPMPLQPAYRDAAMGITFYELPDGFTLDEKTTREGRTVSWVWREGEDTLGGLSAALRPPIKGDFALWADSQARSLEKDERVRGVEMQDIYLSGRKGVLIEYRLAFQGGALLNTRWQIAIPGEDRLYTFSCSAETNNFEDHMRPVFERLFHSVTIEE